MTITHNQTIGKKSYSSHRVIWGSGNSLHIGSYCSIAERVIFCLGGNHNLDAITTFPIKSKETFSNGDIIVGNDVWIGFGAFILSGSKIEDGAVIGAMSVVSGSVPAYSIYAGNPARCIRKRFSDEHIEKLLEIKWWNWDDAKVSKYSSLLSSNDIQQFIEAVK